MAFTEHATSRLQVEPPEFKCDAVIGKDIEEPLPKAAFFMALMGSAGSGKTSLMVNLLTKDGMYKKCFDHVHLIAPEASMKSLKNDIWAKHPGDKVHHSLDVMTLDDIDNRANVRRAKKPPETTLLIIDDMTVMLKKKEIEAKLRKMVFNRRHNYTSIMILVQSYIAMPLDLRKTLSHFFMFKPRNKKEAEAIWDELLNMSKKVGDELLRFVFQEPHDFLMGDTNTGTVYRNFNLVECPEDIQTAGIIDDKLADVASKPVTKKAKHN